MPELPEIEVIKLGLQKRIVGLKLTKIQVNSAKSFIGNPNLVEGQKIVKVWRKAKILGIDLDERTLLVHLKMSGQLVFGEMPNKHTRVIISFSDGSHLYFNDQRKFGWVKIVNRKSLIVNRFLGKLGPEPLEKDFTWQVLKQNLLKHKNMPVKVAIMDQSVVSGLGNIYANEACFDARINPQKKAGELTEEEFKSLHRGALKALRDGIKYGGSSRAHFIDYVYFSKKNSPTVYVYGKNKHKCKICGTKIKKISLAGRGTYFCPNCQK